MGQRKGPPPKGTVEAGLLDLCLPGAGAEASASPGSSVCFGHSTVLVAFGIYFISLADTEAKDPSQLIAREWLRL